LLALNKTNEDKINQNNLSNIKKESNNLKNNEE